MTPGEIRCSRSGSTSRSIAYVVLRMDRVLEDDPFHGRTGEGIISRTWFWYTVLLLDGPGAGSTTVWLDDLKAIEKDELIVPSPVEISA